MEINLKIQTLSYAPILFKPSLPDGFEGIVLPGSIAQFASGSFGSFLIQEIGDEQFSLQLCIVETIQPFATRIERPGSEMFIRIALEQSLKHVSDISEEINIKAGEFAKMWQSRELITHYEQYKKSIYIDTYFSKSLYEEIKLLIPDFDFDSIPARSKRADTTTGELIDSILHCRYKDPLRSHFFSARGQELIIQYFFQWSETETGTRIISALEREAVIEAAEIISKDISRHFTIPELARKVKMGEYRFKIAFKLLHGSGPYEYLMKKRLKIAKVLLEKGYSVKEVAGKTGYHVSHFIEVFKEHMNITPGELKARKKK